MQIWKRNIDIENINKDMNKEEKSFDEWMNEYYENYKPKEIKELKLLKKKKKYIIFGTIVLLLSLTIIFLAFFIT